MGGADRLGGSMVARRRHLSPACSSDATGALHGPERLVWSASGAPRAIAAALRQRACSRRGPPSVRLMSWRRQRAALAKAAAIALGAPDALQGRCRDHAMAL